MSKLFSSRKVIKTLEEHDFVFVSQRGGHMKFFNDRNRLTVIVPANKRQIPIGTFSSVLRQSGLGREDFE